MDIAMVQMIENHAVIAGDLVIVEADPARVGIVTLQIMVRAAHDVAGSPNFFARDIGQSIPITAPADSAFAARQPGPIRLRVKKTGLNISFAEELLGDGD